MRWRLTILGAVFVLAGLGALPALAFDHAEGVPDAEHATFEEVVEYYESGRYEHDANRIGRRAKRALVRELDELPGGHGNPKPAIVFDIDDTALSLYECEKEQGDFGSTQLIPCVVEAGVDTAAGGNGLPRIEPVYRLFRKAQRWDVAIFFITGRPTTTRVASKQNLKAQGYDGYKLTTYPAPLPGIGVSLIPYKSRERARIEREGYEILVNIGDQESDLKGGYGNRKFLMPNPMYFTP